jgi:DNA polymerase
MAIAPNESASLADMTAQQAAALLLWLRDMGADEGQAEAPINRFTEAPPSTAPKPVSEKPALARPAAAPPKSAALPDASIEHIHAAARSAASLEELAQLLNQFDAHPLRRTASKLCLTGGAPGSRVLVLADRPRNEEDRSGQVFADKHEVLCQRMLAAIGLGEGLEPVSFLNFMPWRPPGNRPPNELECRLIVPFAQRAIELLQPKFIFAMGALSGQWLAGGPESIQRQRGTWLSVGGVPLISTFHPEALLKSPALKRLAWLDLLALKAKLAEMP